MVLRMVLGKNVGICVLVVMGCSVLMVRGVGKIGFVGKHNIGDGDGATT